MLQRPSHLRLFLCLHLRSANKRHAHAHAYMLDSERICNCMHFDKNQFETIRGNSWRAPNKPFFFLKNLGNTNQVIQKPFETQRNHKWYKHIF